ncbi:MAG: HEPN domain-containing protein [Treponema sp.]|jgi:HEPN domain-containing protein|nr:HEPN domain-containing protein [Treponema sp.]
METKTILEWFYFADADYDSALILNEAHRKHNEIICFHCQQAAEKYLKAFLCYKGIIPPKIHILETLCALCSEYDSSFNDIAKDCAYLSPFAVRARYPLEIEITNSNTVKALETAKKIMGFSPLAELKTKLLSENG